MRGTISALVAAATLCSCVTPPRSVRERTDPGHGAILMAFSFKGRVLPYWRRHVAEELFFARVLPDGSFDPAIVPANYRAGDRLYALDVPAGKYAPIAASYFTGRSRQLLKLAPASSRKWAVDVRPGELTFAGVVEVYRTTDGWGTPAWNWLKRVGSYLPPFKRAVITIEYEATRHSVAKESELEALRLARVDLTGTFWAEVVSARLAALGNPPPELFEGLVRKKSLPRKNAETFSYIDTLGWGEPQRVERGLQWQPGKERAWISLTLVPPQGAGAKPLAGILRELREAGSSDDSHTVAELAVSSRPAYSGMYTTYVYPEPALVGSKVLVFKTQTVIVPTPAGIYRAQYRADASTFEKYRAMFEQFLRYVDFQAPAAKDKT